MIYTMKKNPVHLLGVICIFENLKYILTPYRNQQHLRQKLLYRFKLPDGTLIYVDCPQIMQGVCFMRDIAGVDWGFKNMKEKQELVFRDAFTPMDAPRARSSIPLSLNGEKNNNEQNLRFHSTNRNVDILHPAGGYKSNMLEFILNGEKKMDVNVKNVKLARYGKDMQFVNQFLSTPTHKISLEAVQ